MRTFYYNAKVYLSKGHFADAMIVDGSDIESVGTFEGLEHEAQGAVRVDCEGRTIVPGFNDSHCHVKMVGEAMSRPQIMNIKSIDAIVELCRQFAEDHPNVRTDGLAGFGWNQDLFTEGEKRVPNRHDLDRISTEFPVVLERACGHILTCNTKAIELLGLDENSPDLTEGSFWREENGYPSGVFAEAGGDLPRSLIAAPDFAKTRANFKNALDYASSLGITSVQSNDLTVGKNDDMTFGALADIYEKGEGKVRYHCQICCDTPEDLKRSVGSGLFSKYAQPLYDRMLSVGQLKLFKDGSLGARTALMRKDYEDDPGNRGMDCLDADAMYELVKTADSYGIQTVTHVIGDGAVEGVVECYEKVLDGRPNINRHGLIHCQITDKALMERIKASDIRVFYQPIFLHYDLHVVEDRVGKETASTSYAFGTAIRSGIHTSFGTDSPVEDINPYDGIYCAVTRSDLTGFPEGGFYPQERITVEEAVDAYTIGGAEAQFAERWKGRIAPGYVADFVILDRDIFTVPAEEIRKVRPVCTVLGGETVYTR